ncbi:MAG: 50S ribosomal protein L24 [Gammaproteobacteria bacterium]|nr:50S ribosomal protein L24 [Gammaproteobacteria bacterium]
MRKLKKGDEVIILTGKDKGRRGTLQKVLPNSRVIVDNVNMVKKHTKGNPMMGVPGGIVEKEASIHISNVAIYNPGTDKADKIGIRTLQDGKKVRFFRSNNETVDG